MLHADLFRIPSVFPSNVFSDESAANILEHDYNSGSVHKRRLRSLRRVPLSRKGGFFAHDSGHKGILGRPSGLDVRLRGRSRRLRHVLHHARTLLYHRGNLSSTLVRKSGFICNIREHVDDVPTQFLLKSISKEFLISTLMRVEETGFSLSKRKNFSLIP